MTYRPTSAEFDVHPDPQQGGVAVTRGNLLAVLQAALQQGEVVLASRLYEESGRGLAEQLSQALLKAPAPVREAGVRMFEHARDFGRAARLCEGALDWPRAARLHEEEGDLAAAGHCHERAGNMEKAARAYDAGGLAEKAIPLYEELGEKAAHADCLLRAGRPYAAAKLFRELKNVRGEIEALRLVATDAQERGAAVKRLADLLVARNRTAEATQVLAEALRENATAGRDLELNERLLALFEKQGRPEHAERMRQRVARLRKPGAAPEAKGARAPAGGPDEQQSTVIRPVPKRAAAPLPPAPHTPLAGNAPVKLETDPAHELAQLPEEGYAFLKSIPLFGRLSLADMKDLYRAMSEVTFNPGQVLTEVGVEGPGLFVIVEGTAEVLALGAGGARHLNSLGPGDFVGEISLISRSLTSARVIASTWTRALAVDRTRFDYFLYSHPGAAVRIYRLFCERLAERVRALSVP